MTSIDHLIRTIIELRARGTQITLLAVCPNSDAVLEAAVKVAGDNNMPMLFAATLNQVDREGGYTGWTPRAFVDRMRQLAIKYRCDASLYPCLDHGGPWLKDAHTQQRLTLDETMAEVKATLTTCLNAGYKLLHVDPTVDRTLPAGQSPQIDVVVERTVELIAHAESQRKGMGLPQVSYEVGTEEVHGGLVDMDNFSRFLSGLQTHLGEAGLGSAWPCFVVGKVGTDLHTTMFDPKSARRLYDLVAPMGSLIKGHYTDWVENPAEYPASGMGGANVGPEFTSTELSALGELCDLESRLKGERAVRSHCGLKENLRAAVIDSNRWQKWLLPHEHGCSFNELEPARQEWLVATGARYVWTDPRVLAARQELYDSVSIEYADPNDFVVDRIAQNIQMYVDAFNLRDSLPILMD